MDLSLLDTLKTKLNEAKKFYDVYDYFLTNFGEKEEFIKLGERTRDDFIESVLGHIAQQLFNKPVLIGNMMLTKIPEYNFIHGTVMLEGKLTSVLYFEDINKGMLAILWGGRPPETKFVRFTGQTAYDAMKRSNN